MKIVYYGNFTNDWNTESYVARALERCGATVFRIQEQDNPDEALKWLRYVRQENGPMDVFLFAKCKFRKDWGATKGTLCFLRAVHDHCKKVVCWVWDLLNPLYSVQRYQWALAISELCDLFCTTDGSIFAQGLPLPNSKLLRQGVGDDVIPRHQVTERDYLKAEILFIGEAYGERREFIEQMHQRYHRRFWHIPSGYRGPILNEVMKSVTHVIGPHWPLFPQYWSNRIYVVAGYGGCYVGPYIKGMEEEGWLPGIHYVEVDYPKESVLGYPSIFGIIPPSENIKEEAQRFVLQNHTYDHRAMKLMEWME